MPDAEDVLVIVPHFRRPDQLNRCLAALKQSTGVSLSVYVHDNNVTNVGFTKACNAGLRVALQRRHPYALLLNQDCYVEPDMIARLVALMAARPKCAIAGAMQVSTVNPDQIVHGGCAGAYPNGRHLLGSRRAGDCAADAMMPWISGSVMFVRLSAVAEFGLMDENMLLICSDADWCYTARLRGWEVWYCGSAVCAHEQGVSSTPAKGMEFIQIMGVDSAYFKAKWVDGGAFRLLASRPDAAPPRAM